MPCSATKTPARMNGAARPSLSPASAVSAKFGSCSSSSPGGPTPMSPASTGSVGASAAPSSSAAAAGRASSQAPSSATSAIVIGIANTSRRTTELQSRSVSGRSSFSPAENSAMISAASARCSISSASAIGSSHPTPTRREHDRGRGPEPEVDQRRGERPLALVGERADGREHREPDEQDREVVPVGELEAGTGGEGQDYSTSGPPGSVGLQRDQNAPTHCMNMKIRQSAVNGTLVPSPSRIAQ